MRPYRFIALLLSHAIAQTATPGVPPTTQEQLLTARAKAHEHTEKLDRMTDEEWQAHKARHPGKNASETLEQARAKAHKHETKLDSMGPLQYEHQQMRHNRRMLLQPSTPAAAPLPVTAIPAQ